MKNSKKAFHEQVAENLIAQLKQGTAPWQKPWQPGDPLTALPHNTTTGNRYRGINALQLMSQPFADTRWMTYKQASALGAQVKKGEKSTQIQYWKFNEARIKKDDNGKQLLNSDGQPIKELLKLERPRAFYANVFNAEQIDGLPPLNIKAPDWNPLERAEQILQASHAVIKHGELDRAFYRPTTDHIHLPHQNQFSTSDGYYSVALHELGHWTGHESRLNRDLSNPFGSEAYAKEELRAEIASMLLGHELGIGHDPGQHAAYVDHWIKALQEDPKEIFRAAADAEKIQDYVLSLSQQQAVKEQEEIKVNQIRQQSVTYSVRLSPDVATVATGNIKMFAVLMERLHRREQDAIYLISDARKFYQSGSIDNLAFEETALKQLGFSVPADWNGATVLIGKVTVIDDDGSNTILPAKKMGMEPQFWGVYALKEDGSSQLLKDFDVKQQADDLVDLMDLINAASDKNEYEKSVKLASIHLNRVRNDPSSTEKDISMAMEQHKLAESLAPTNDKSNVIRIVDMEEKQADNMMANQNQTSFKKYLAVPYKEKDLAKAAGANWDNKAKAWYVGQNADIRALQRWFPENAAKPQTPAMSPEVEFTEFLRAHGCIVDGNHPVMDGQKQRIKLG